MPKQVIPTMLGDRIQDGDYRDALPVNMYVVERKVRGSDGYLINQPGIKPLGETPGSDRGAFFSSRFNKHLRVSGTRLISINMNGSFDDLGAIPGSLQVIIDESFNNVAILAEGNLYYWNPINGLRQISDPNLGTPIDLCFIRGVFLFTDGANLYHTTLADEEIINPTDFATSEISPDPTVSVNRTKANQAIVGDRHTTSYFYFSGGENFAFSTIDGQASKSGPISPNVVAELDGEWFYIGGEKEESLFIYQATGSNHAKISTREIDKILATYTTEELQNASLESRGEDGYHFLHINLPNDTLLFNYTIARKLGVRYSWTKLKTSITLNDGWRGVNGIFDGNLNKWVYGDRSGNRVGTLDNTISTIYGDKTEFLWFTPFVTLDGMSINQITLKTISGFSDGPVPVAISITYNGETYGQEWMAQYSSKNKRDLRFEPRRLGNVDDYVGFKFRATTDGLLNVGAMELDYG